MGERCDAHIVFGDTLVFLTLSKLVGLCESAVDIRSLNGPDDWPTGRFRLWSDNDDGSTTSILICAESPARSVLAAFVAKAAAERGQAV